MRIAAGGILHETSTFAPTPTTMYDFEHDRGIIRDRDVLERFRGTNVCMGGFIDGADTHGFELVPLLRASAFPGGLIKREDYDSIKTSLLDRLRRAHEAAPLDGAAELARNADPHLELIDSTLEWAQAWADQRPADYLRHYSRRFQPPRSMSRGAWEAQRTDRRRGNRRRIRIGRYEAANAQSSGGRCWCQVVALS